MITSAAYRVVNANLLNPVNNTAHSLFKLPDFLLEVFAICWITWFYVVVPDSTCTPRIRTFSSVDFSSLPLPRYSSARRIIICRGRFKIGLLFTGRGSSGDAKSMKPIAPQNEHTIRPSTRVTKLWLQFGASSLGMRTIGWRLADCIGISVFVPAFFIVMAIFLRHTFADSIIFQPGRCVIDSVFIASRKLRVPIKAFAWIVYSGNFVSLLFPWFGKHFHNQPLRTHTLSLRYFDWVVRSVRLIRHQ